MHALELWRLHAPETFWPMVIVIGATIGSFINALVFRWPALRAHGALTRPAWQTTLWSRSHCPECGTSIPAWLNVPILAWLVLRGRARCCGVAIPARYITVEAGVAVLTAGLVYGLPMALAPWAVVVAWVAVALGLITGGRG